MERDNIIRTFYYYSWRKWFIRIFNHVNVEINLERLNSWRIEIGTYHTSFVLHHYKHKSRDSA